MLLRMLVCNVSSVSVGLFFVMNDIGCVLLFLPSYSPDLNPIEQSFSYGESLELVLFLTLLINLWFISQVKYHLQRHWQELQNGEFPILDLEEACYASVTDQKAIG